jgi:hypothetical protein
VGTARPGCCGGNETRDDREQECLVEASVERGANQRGEEAAAGERGAVRGAQMGQNVRFASDPRSSIENTLNKCAYCYDIGPLEDLVHRF